MKLAKSHVVRILVGIMLMISCTQAVPKLKTKPAKENEDETNTTTDIPRNHRKQLDDEIDLDDAFDAEQLQNEQLPVLPPIILLDFVNGTDDKSNSLDEKSKRTIDSNLGYGFNTNNLFSGKHNFYFPSGKTGTSVSIEESISPFEPKTVTEIEKPITEKSQEGDHPDDQKTEKPQSFETLPKALPLQTQRDSLPIYPPYPIYGQRTKLHKTSSSDFHRQNHYQMPKPFPNSYNTAATSGSDMFNRLLSSYNMKQPGYQTGLSGHGNLVNVNNYARPMTSQYLNSYMADTHAVGGNQKPAYDLRPSQSQTVTSADGQKLNLANYPRYTVENGVRYEHKIVWKYPNGKISETPPPSYGNMQTEYPEQHNLKHVATTGGFRPSIPYQMRPATPQQYQSGLKTSHSSYVTASAQTNNIYSQKPVQFPNDQEQTNNQDEQKDQNQYVSSSGVSGLSSVNQDVTNLHNLDAQYQGHFGLRQNVKPSSYKSTLVHNSQYDSYGNRISNGQFTNVNNADAAFSYYGGNQQNGQSIFNANGQINKDVLSKYTPEVQSYLKKVFTNGKQTVKNDYQNTAPDNFANTDYSSLLNYNPSISQYIKNPSSILKAQPTFIQAGNSLIPVIILRVDGAPPAQPKKKSNINLKALLQQYLSEYANSVSELAQNTNYDLGTGIGEELTSQTNPVEDLKHLTETLTSLRQRGHQDPDFTNSYQRHSNIDGSGQDYASSYSELTKASQKATTAHQPSFSSTTTKRPTKVKSVTIIKDPRYTSYKYESH